MRILLEEIDPEGDDILSLLDHEGDAVWRLWVKPHLTAGTKKPGTLISYLTSYEKFLRFVPHERFNKNAPALHPSHIDHFAMVLKDLKGWRSTVDSNSYHVKNKCIVDETEGLLNLNELVQIKKSRCYNDAIRLLVLAGKGKELTNSEFVLVRDFLLTRFSLDTGTRPGPLDNATMEEYEKSKVDNGCKVMLVVKHKRAKDGPAICPMLPELHKFMEVYRRNIRPHFACQDEQALFVTNEGTGFREGSISRRLTFVERCGVNLAGRMAFVDMCKLITTEMFDRCSPEEQAILRRVLAHSEKTSREWYTRPNLTTTGVQAVNIILRLLDPQEKARFQGKTAKGSPDKKPPLPLERAMPATSDRAADSKASSSGIVPPSDASGPTSLTAMQREELEQIFSKEIEVGKT